MSTFHVPAVGVIDGVNTTFTTGSPNVIPYVKGTMFHHLNGSIKTPADTDGLIETNPAAGIVDLKVAPRVGDRVILVVNDGVGTEITTGVSAVIRRDPSVRAVIADGRLSVTVAPTLRITAQVDSVPAVIASIKVPKLTAEVSCE